jgi:hypothetical protein
LKRSADPAADTMPPSAAARFVQSAEDRCGGDLLPENWAVQS